jgi:hypothetical protein
MDVSLTGSGHNLKGGEMANQVQERVERRPTQRQVVRYPTRRRGFRTWRSALVGGGLFVAAAVALAVAIFDGGTGPAPVESGWALEQSEMDMIAARLAPREASIASVWELSPAESGFIAGEFRATASQPIGVADLAAAEMEFITGRAVGRALASHPVGPLGLGDLSSAELEFVAGQSAMSDQSTGRWGLDPAEIGFMAR